MKAFTVKPMKNGALGNSAIPAKSATTQPSPVHIGPNNIPMIILGMKSTLTFKKVVSMETRRDKTTVRAIRSPMIAMERAVNFFFISSISLTELLLCDSSSHAKNIAMRNESSHTNIAKHKYAANAKTRPRIQ